MSIKQDECCSFGWKQIKVNTWISQMMECYMHSRIWVAETRCENVYSSRVPGSDAQPGQGTRDQRRSPGGLADALAD